MRIKWKRAEYCYYCVNRMEMPLTSSNTKVEIRSFWIDFLYHPTATAFSKLLSERRYFFPRSESYSMVNKSSIVVMLLAQLHMTIGLDLK
eukprot:gene8620-6052_t